MQQHPILIGKQNGEYLYLEGDEHVALYAKSGSGKTSGAVIPNCLSWKGSLVVLDIKGEAFRATAGYRSQVLGQDVYVFDPAAADGRSHRWNPLSTVERKSVDRFDQISRQAFMLFPDATTSQGSMSSTDAFWVPSARSAFQSVGLLLAETESAKLTMTEVLRKFSSGDSLQVLADMINLRRETDQRQYSQIIIDGISDYVNGSTDLVHSVRRMTSTRLQQWFNPRVTAATATSDFDLRDLRRKPMTIYVRVQPGNIPRMRPLLALFFDALVNLNSDATPDEDPSLQYQTLVVLDEFRRLGRMDILAEAAQYIRGYGLRFFYILQNIAQLRAVYGTDGAQDILDNTGAEIVFGTNDLALTKELSERMGDDTIDVTTLNRPRFMPGFNWSKQSEATHPHRRPLMLAQEIARMDRSEQIILRAGMMPMKTQRAYWRDDPHFRSLALPPPIVPQLNIDIAVDDGKTEILTKKEQEREQVTA